MATNYTTGSGQYPDATPNGAPGYQEVTRAEEFQDKITIMSPNDTPLLSILPTRPISNIDYSWMVDDVPSPSSVSATEEGGDATAEASARQRLYNQAMLYMKRVSVSGTQRQMNEKGIDDEYSYQLVKKGLEVAKQFEWNLLYSSFVPRVGTATAGQTAGLVEWLAETGAGRNETIDEGGIIGAGTSMAQTVHPDFNSVWYKQASGNMSEDQFNANILSPAWQNGADINSSLIMVGSALKRHMSKYGLLYDNTGQDVPLTRMNERAAEAVRHITIDTWMTEFGEIHVCLNRYFVATGTYTTNDYGLGAIAVTGDKMLIGIDPQFFSIPTVRPIQYAPLGKTADADDALVLAEMGLQVDNPIAGFGGSSLLA